MSGVSVTQEHTKINRTCSIANVAQHIEFDVLRRPSEDVRGGVALSKGDIGHNAWLSINAEDIFTVADLVWCVA